ncbi:calcium-transporting ATPase 1 [Clostridium acetireducens DSM 10703]|uniref:Calcium-transporting ATPase 1 n=1 Tax=Clostridium acetireducens DSM 10703 TaxID=1121290 RepID=A0A1E8F153_9CLOT|nr:cation-transporting P-type ATPase [Clostridium acetireducens]OFI07203.1 calcium-transporting ATPase 1 [Clostridium acetireducens DSM 10703]
MSKWCNETWTEVVRKLNSDIYTGLKYNQIEKMRKKCGKNEIMIPKSKSFIILFLKALIQLWTLVIIVISVVLYFKFNSISSIILFIMAVLNAIIMSSYEYKDERRLSELQRIDSKECNVIRDRRNIVIPSEELVVGDIVFLEKGDIVPADLRIIESNSLKVVEGAVTGEGYTVEKYETKIEEKELSLSEMRNILFRSSVVLDGSATGIVITSGMDTQIANIISMLFEEKNTKNLLNKKITKIINKLAIVSLMLALVCFGILITFGVNFSSSLLFTLLFLTASVPEGINLIILLMFKIIFNNMKKRGVHFKNLSTLETLSQISVICLDKIGSLFEEEMKLEKVYSSEQYIDIYEEKVRLIEDKNYKLNSNIQRMLKIGLLCNDTKFNENEIVNPKQDLMEIALFQYGIENSINKVELELEQERILQIPFDTERRIMTTINKKADNKYRANVKGALDTLLGKCTYIVKNGVEMPITEEDIRNIKKADIKMSYESLSVIGFAYRDFNYEPSLKENIESNLVFVGIAGFKNPEKIDAKEVIQECKSIGIKPVIITEDNKITAFAQGKNVGLLDKQKQVLSGIEMDNMTEDELNRNLGFISVFSRINSNNKAKIAKFFKDNGAKILIQGTRITDLPALKIADVGVTSGKSNIVKNLSDIALKDVDFYNILEVLKESRKIINVLKKIILYLYTICAAQISFVFMCLVFNNQALINPFYILYINVITAVASSIALIFQYETENFSYKPLIINSNILKENKNSIIIKGFFIGVIAFIPCYIIKLVNTEFTNILAFTVLNLAILVLAYDFSDNYIFNSKISNFIMFFQVLIQLLAISLVYGINVFLNSIFWIYVLVALLVWISIITLFKIQRKNQELEF